MATALYSVLHFLVDGVCAWAMFGRFLGADGGYGAILIYNFCAFALQLPLGAVIDQLPQPKAAGWFAGLGVVLTLAGAFSHPAILGLGNALFHVGGGVGVIREDWAKHWKGQALGIFVAPGALGLYLGGQAGQTGFLTPGWLIPAGILMVLLAVVVPADRQSTPPAVKGNGLWMAVCCFAVVVLRSHVGMAVTFSWKTGFWMGLAAVAAVVLGKVSGGLLAARFGMRAVTALSLNLAALGYWLGEVPGMGLLALLCFNMTMPLTLYALVSRFPAYPGSAFGLLTFGLFLGFLPTYYGWAIPLGGAAGSLCSLALLWKAVHDHDSYLCGLSGADAGH